MQKVNQQFQVYWNVRWLRRSVITAIVIGLILLAIPVIAQYGMIHLLKNQGASHVQLEDINFNPFAGSLGLKQLEIISGDHEPTLVDHVFADVNMQQLLPHRIVVDELKVKGIRP